MPLQVNTLLGNESNQEKYKHIHFVVSFFLSNVPSLANFSLNPSIMYGVIRRLVVFFAVGDVAVGSS